jgi:amidase
VSANLCVVAIGTETNGSVVSPSSINGIVGIKPTVGLLSRSGIIPISKTQDTAGPMARTVKDAALLLAALTGVDADDPVTQESQGKAPKDYVTGLDGNGLKGKKLGVEKTALTGHEGIVAALEEALSVLKAQGATIVEVELQKQLTEPGSVEGMILQYEFKDGVNKYLATANAPVKTLSEVIAYNKVNWKKAMPYFKQETLERSDARGALDSQEYLDALKKLLTSRTIIDDLLRQNQLDAIVSVTTGPACCIDLVAGDYRTGGGGFSGPAAMAGYPHITVPMGLVLGLPVGLSFVGSAYTEPALIWMAYAYEQASKKRVAPGLINAANF